MECSDRVTALRHIVTPARQSFGRGRCTPKLIIFTTLRAGMDKRVCPCHPTFCYKIGILNIKVEANGTVLSADRQAFAPIGLTAMR